MVCASVAQYNNYSARMLHWLVGAIWGEESWLGTVLGNIFLLRHCKAKLCNNVPVNIVYSCGRTVRVRNYGELCTCVW